MGPSMRVWVHDACHAPSPGSDPDYAAYRGLTPVTQRLKAGRNCYGGEESTGPSGARNAARVVAGSTSANAVAVAIPTAISRTASAGRVSPTRPPAAISAIANIPSAPSVQPAARVRAQRSSAG